ncbi:Hypothetical predicted protein [Mytilus galloprovincialis]|uniref:Uncharacterized protein n=1 Tax=Mytilus galloprovincialis TaxID=29158 RepID=A0A8B6EWS0_MYTGA|nr:Hypothetical predicted protein [Mytilus galloprovincialis]
MNNYRKRIRADLTSTPKSDEGIPFSNRMDKARSIKKLKQALPITPNKRAAVLSAYVDCNRILKSPGVKKFHDSFEESVEKMAIRNIQDVITSVKHKRNGEAKAALNILTSSVSGENISDRKRATKSLANILGNEPKRIVHDFWLQSNVSRPTNNKNDIKRVRISPNVYSSHSCYILEKTQTEVFLQFKNEYPDEKIGQRAFEKCKPYFVRTAQFKDKVTCCCRQHVEMRSLFKSCMQFRKRLLSREGSSEVKLYESLSELVDDTLCTRSANTHQHKISCLDRLCSECGVCKFSMLPGELDESDVQISWERYEYKNVKVKGHCVTVHDFSENYKCTEQNEIQSSYFQKLEVSLHVTILHRHSVLEYDGKDSTAEEPNIVTEQFFVISPDQKHDHHYTHCVQNLVSEYLKSINCEISVMHEFTDGCSSQYKSRHCMGDTDTERQTNTDRQRQTETYKQKHTETYIQTETYRHTEIDPDRLRQTDRQRQTDTDTDRHQDTETQTEKHRHTDRHRETETESQTQTDKPRQTQRDRQKTDKQRLTDSDRQTQRWTDRDR